MSFTPNWATKVFTIPIGDLTFVSGVNYTLDADDVWIEIRRLEASAANNGGLYAEQALEFINTQTLSGLPYSAIVKLINGYTWEVDASNIIVSLLGKNSNLLDTFVPANGVSVLANNSAGKIETGSGLDAGQDQKLTDIDLKTDAIEIYSLETWQALGLEVGNKITITPSGLVDQSGNIIVSFTGDGVTSTVMERQP